MLQSFQARERLVNIPNLLPMSTPEYQLNKIIFFFFFLHLQFHFFFPIFKNSLLNIIANKFTNKFALFRIKLYARQAISTNLMMIIIKNIQFVMFLESPFIINTIFATHDFGKIRRENEWSTFYFDEKKFFFVFLKINFIFLKNLKFTSFITKFLFIIS